MIDPPTEEFYYTRYLFDIGGNLREVSDAKDRVIMRYDYSLLSAQIHQASMEAGERWALNDVADKPVRMWDSRENTLRIVYDALHRRLCCKNAERNTRNGGALTYS
ncbi:hypothetical protein KDH_79450 [Dictyobacter sp. S3.2.2.5]|uniref:Uncharacterized protein n=1 Tax=Dictyobacter halimunensis TaxID=3026934 RepID=A0ABQ6G7R5_9CHLR|nr:hypothetical protein KDH_79450 [Dictyobacter sp. S3.2.2.5]